MGSLAIIRFNQRRRENRQWLEIQRLRKRRRELRKKLVQDLTKKERVEILRAANKKYRREDELRYWNRPENRKRKRIKDRRAAEKIRRTDEYKKKRRAYINRREIRARYAGYSRKYRGEIRALELEDLGVGKQRELKSGVFDEARKKAIPIKGTAYIQTGLRALGILEGTPDKAMPKEKLIQHLTRTLGSKTPDEIRRALWNLKKLGILIEKNGWLIVNQTWTQERQASMPLLTKFAVPNNSAKLISGQIMKKHFLNHVKMGTRAELSNNGLSLREANLRERIADAIMRSRTKTLSVKEIKKLFGHTVIRNAVESLVVDGSLEVEQRGPSTKYKISREFYST